MLALVVSLLVPAPTWANHTYDLSPQGPKAVTLVNSLWERGSPVEERVTLRTQVEGDLNGDGKPEAVLLFEYWGGGQERDDLVHVYTLDKDRYGRTAVLDGGWGKDGSLDSVAIRDGKVQVGHDVQYEGAPPLVLVREYRLLPQGLVSDGVIDLRARDRAEPLADLKAKRVAARALLTKDPKAGARAYLEIHAVENTPESLADAAFALMKADAPLARDALTAAAHRASSDKLRDAAYYNLARYHLDHHDDGAAIEAVRQSLRVRPDNEPTKKLLTLLQAGLGVRGIDWGNRTYQTGDGPGDITLSNGSWEGRLEGDDFSQSLDLAGVDYGDIDGDGLEEALVHLNYWGGGTGRFDSLDVYNAKGEIIGSIPGGDRADGGIGGTAIKDRRIHISRMFSGPSGGACCPEFTVEETWAWEGGRFVEHPELATLTSFSAEEVDEATVPGILQKADTAAKNGNSEEAAELLLGVLGTKAHRGKVYALFGYLLGQQGHWGAEPVLIASLQFAKTDAERAATYYNIGRSHQKRMSWDIKGKPKAIAAFETSLKLRPGNKATEAALAEVKATPDKK